jgi:hypothetical protein
MCFFKSAEQAYLEQTEFLPTLKHLFCRNNSFQKLTQFSQGNNILDTPAFNMDHFLYTDICVSSTQCNRPIWSKQSLSQG